jgi:hypothetical protein
MHRRSGGFQYVAQRSLMFPVAGTFTHVHVTFGVGVLLAAVTLAGISSRCGRGMQRLSTGSGKYSLAAAPTIITHSSTICLLVLVRASPLHGNVVRYQLGLALTCNEHLLGQQGIVKMLPWFACLQGG